MAKPPAPDPKAERLAAALRANLARRKARDRATPLPPEPTTESVVEPKD